MSEKRSYARSAASVTAEFLKGNGKVAKNQKIAADGAERTGQKTGGSAGHYLEKRLEKAADFSRFFQFQESSLKELTELFEDFWKSCVFDELGKMTKL